MRYIMWGVIIGSSCLLVGWWLVTRIGTGGTLGVEGRPRRPLFCWWGIHVVTHTMRLDEARVLGWCDRCGLAGLLDSQGHLS